MAPEPAVTSLLRSSVEADPGRAALAFDRRRMGYGDLLTAADRLAGRLAGYADAGDRIAVVAPNAPALILAMHAVWRAGGVAVPLSTRLREYDLRRILSDAEPSAIVSFGAAGGYAFAELIAALAPSLASLRGYLIVDEMGDVLQDVTCAGRESTPLEPRIAAILYTSGTTGAPKGALVTHASLLASGRAMAGLLELGPGDASVIAVPISHAFGLGCLLATIASGGCAVLIESTFSLAPLKAAAERFDATVLHGSPALLATLLKSWPERVPDLRAGFVAGAPCPPEILERLDDAGVQILNLFGMTELGAVTACRPGDPPGIRHSTVGRALPEYELRVSGEGELQVRGPYVTPGYHGRPEMTAEAFQDGWFRTGDVASIDAGGHVSISGRAKEIVRVGGFNVFPAEVEGFLLTHPDVAQAVVVGVPHEPMGEVLEAFVVPRAGARLDRAALLRFARSRIAGYKLPYAIAVVAELPRLASGKPDRAALAGAGAQGWAA